MLAGEAVALPSGEARLDWAHVPPVPVFIAGSGPRILRLAGEVADGAIILTGTAPEYVRAAIETVREGGREAGRDLDREGFRYVCWAPCSIDEDGAAARDFVKAHVARVLRRPLPYELSVEDREVVKRIYEQYEYRQHMVVGTRHGELVPDRLVPKFAIAGTVGECLEQVKQLEDTGLHQVAIVPHAREPSGRLAMVRSFAEHIMANL